MARKKKQTNEPPPENLENTDDTFGLPEVEYQPLQRGEPEHIVEPPQETPPEPPVEENPEVVVINEPSQAEPEPIVAAEEPPPFEFREGSTHEEVHGDDRPDRNRYDDVHQPYTPTYSYQDDTPSPWPKILGILLVLFLIGGGIWYFMMFRPAQQAKAEQERKELAAIQEEARRKEAERQAALKSEEEQKVAETAPPPKPAVGNIETLSGRSGRYYVVIASSIDGDLIMDYAKKLSANGVSTKIIPPFGKSSFHRLAVADGDTYQTTQATADELKGGDYGDKLWVVKY
jgi:hypothetical protein